MSRQLNAPAKSTAPNKKAGAAQTARKDVKRGKSTTLSNNMVRGEESVRDAKAPPPVVDSIDEFVRAWQRERPDLDAWPFAIFGRIWRLSASMVGDAERWLAPVGLTFESFSVIVTLRRAGAPFEMNPTALYRESLLSSGAITNRIDRVEAQGLVKRLPDPNDRRGTIVRLTPKGRALADRSIKLHFEAMAAMLAGIDKGDRTQIIALLGKLLVAVETNREALPKAGRNKRFKRT